MAKRSVSVFLPILVAAFLWSVDGVLCLGDDGSVVGSSTVPHASTASDNSGAPVEIVGISSISLPSACLNSENNGGRQLPSSQGRSASFVRLSGGQGNIPRGSFSRVDDIRSYYGLVRPHLYFCRLLI